MFDFNGDIGGTFSFIQFLGLFTHWLLTGQEEERQLNRHYYRQPRSIGQHGATSFEHLKPTFCQSLFSYTCLRFTVSE